ncbi:MAG: amino acid adenylation domain-containing protein [Ktedonobacteraceae bacterium]|nr:amino acid adenylation domain-containing protein [Ktedonobacteraceae bacterium]
MNIEKLSYVYPLTPLQQGMLFNSMYAPEPGVDIIQVLCSLYEDLHINAFELAWRQIYARHSILRTAFHWEEEAQPTQEIHKQIVFPFHVEDWQSLSDQEHQERLEGYLLADRRRGFALGLPPLLRLALFRFAEAEYRCVLTFHHIILDGRSLPIILDEVFDLYEAFRMGTGLTLPPVCPYHDYVAWLQMQDLTADEPFWRQFLDGFTAPTSLPADRDLESTLDSGASHDEQNITLSLDTRQSLRQLADQYQLTLNTLFQGAWAFVLSRRSGQADVVFGAIRSCRRGTIEGAESMVGLFLNMLPVRVQIKNDVSVIPWLRELRAQGVAVRNHQLTPLIQVQQWSRVPKGMPIFESIFVFENRTLQSTMRMQGGPWLQRDLSVRRKPNYPLALYVFGEQEILVTCIYDKQRFAPITIIYLLEHVQSVLEAMINNPYKCLEQLPMMAEAERQQVLITWNATQQEYPHESCIHHLVEAQAARIPDSLAIQMGRRCWTYRQMNERANQIAHLLRSLGVGPDMHVGIYLERSPEMIVSQLGILKAGGAFVMFDPGSPQERLDFLLEDAQVHVLLTLQEHVANWPAGGMSVIVLDAPVDPLAGRSTRCNPPNVTTGANLAYIIYTSGSTGRPKGVEIQHSSLVNLATWHCQTFAIRKDDRAMHQASLAFDASILEIWPNLMAGASLHLPTEDIWVDPGRMINWLTEQAITIAFLTTPLGETVLQERWPDKSVLRVLSIGGDRLKCGPARETSFSVYNLYGPTECTILATWMRLPPAEDGTLPPIGRPIANTQIYLLDERLEPMPIGAVGELYIGGSGLARGYLNRPELTAERFIPHPFSQQVGALLYRSGDLARYRHDGIIEYMGRIDHQVKVRGFRIELGEIEAILLQHPAVTTALVQTRENERGEKQLVAYLVPKQQQRLDKGNIRRFLHQKLPEYMVPTVIILLNTLPLMPNGKIDYRALPSESERYIPYEAPRTDLETMLTTIWAQVLQIKLEDGQSLGIHDNFFELGAHSLLAAQAILRINKLLRIRLPVRSIFDAPTIALLARYIEDHSGLYAD